MKPNRDIRPHRRGRPQPAQLHQSDVPYIMKLPDGRSVYVDVPGRLTVTDRDGQIGFTPEGVTFLDRIRALALRENRSPTPGYITAVRRALGLTQAQLGARLGVNKLTVSRWERGALRPSASSLQALADLKRHAAGKGIVIAA